MTQQETEEESLLGQHKLLYGRLASDLSTALDKQALEQKPAETSPREALIKKRKKISSTEEEYCASDKEQETRSLEKKVGVSLSAKYLFVFNAGADARHEASSESNNTANQKLWVAKQTKTFYTLELSKERLQPTAEFVGAVQRALVPGGANRYAALLKIFSEYGALVATEVTLGVEMKAEETLELSEEEAKATVRNSLKAELGGNAQKVSGSGSVEYSSRDSSESYAEWKREGKKVICRGCTTREDICNMKDIPVDQCVVVDVVKAEPIWNFLDAPLKRKVEKILSRVAQFSQNNSRAEMIDDYAVGQLWIAVTTVEMMYYKEEKDGSFLIATSPFGPGSPLHKCFEHCKKLMPDIVQALKEDADTQRKWFKEESDRKKKFEAYAQLLELPEKHAVGFLQEHELQDVEVDTENTRDERERQEKRIQAHWNRIPVFVERLAAEGLLYGNLDGISLVAAAVLWAAAATCPAGLSKDEAMKLATRSYYALIPACLHQMKVTFRKDARLGQLEKALMEQLRNGKGDSRHGKHGVEEIFPGVFDQDDIPIMNAMLDNVEVGCELRGHFENIRIVLVTGTTGAGKTSLIKQLGGERYTRGYIAGLRTEMFSFNVCACERPNAICFLDCIGLGDALEHGEGGDEKLKKIMSTLRALAHAEIKVIKYSGLDTASCDVLSERVEGIPTLTCISHVESALDYNEFPKDSCKNTEGDCDCVQTIKENTNMYGRPLSENCVPVCFKDQLHLLGFDRKTKRVNPENKIIPDCLESFIWTVDDVHDWVHAVLGN